MTATIALPREMFERMRKQAFLLGATAAELAASLLRVIVRDNLYNAVLDDEDRAQISRSPRLRNRPTGDIHKVYLVRRGPSGIRCQGRIAYER